MTPPSCTRNVRLLVVLIIVGIAFSSLLRLHVRLTGVHQVDGILGVMLGLYTCSQPAANVLDLVLFGRYLPVQSAQHEQMRWWSFNILALLVGWWVIVTSLLRFSALN